MTDGTLQMRDADQSAHVTHFPIVGVPDSGVLSQGGPVVQQITEIHRQRQDLKRAEQRLTLQVKAVCRRTCQGDKDEAERLYKAMTGGGDHPGLETAIASSLPLLEARSVVTESIKPIEKYLDQLAGQLPVAEWVRSVQGFGLGSLAAIVGEAGDLSLYPNPAKLWARMGLKVMPDGTRQRRVSGADAADHGYSPTRRSIAWNVGASIIKARGSYYPDYDAFMHKEIDKALEEGLVVATNTKATVDSWAKRGLPTPEKVTRLDPSLHRSCGHIHNRAKRKMEKKVLRDLWKEWNRV